MRKRPELALETVLAELKMPLIYQGQQPERAYVVLQKHEKQVHVSTSDDDLEQQMETLMSEMWVPLGFVAYYGEASNPVTRPLSWYSELLVRDERRYGQLCRTVYERLGMAARRLTSELAELRMIPRLQ